MANKPYERKTAKSVSSQPLLHQRAAEIQPTDVNIYFARALKSVRLEMTAHLNQLLADTMTLRDLYKKSHWQVAGPTFYQLHLLSISTSTNRSSWWIDRGAHPAIRWR